MEADRMQDVLLLIEQLIRHEEATVKLILGCLYDVGAVNLINQRFQQRSVNRLLKGAARLSKPVFKMVALRWFKSNCPRLIVEWLHSKVKFEDSLVDNASTIAADTLTNHPTSLSELADNDERELLKLRSQLQLLSFALATLPAHSDGLVISADSALNKPEPANQEISRLRSQVKLLTTVLIGVSLALGGALVWLVQHPQPDRWQSSQVRSAVLHPVSHTPAN